MAKTILLADDSSTIRKIVELAFGGTDIRVISAADGAEAAGLLDSARPDLLLADVVMPPPDGYQLCREVKSSARPIPVVLLAGTFEPYDPAAAGRCGADGHLVKPFESELLRRKVRELLAVPPGELRRPAGEAPSPSPRPQPRRGAGQGLAVTDATPESAPAVTLSEPPAEEEPPRRLSDADVERVAARVLDHLTSDVVREWVRRHLPDLADRAVRERIRELELLDTDDGPSR